MPKQTLIFVVLPNGVTPRKTLNVSVYMTPRLESGTTLGAFPDILNWAELVQNNGLKLAFKCGGNSQTVPVDQSVLRPDVWKLVFKKTQSVEAYKVPDFDQRLIVSYPVRDATAFLKYAYQAVGAGSVGTTTERGGLRGLMQDLIFRDGSKSILASALSKKRLELWSEQRGNLLAGVANQVPDSVVAGPLAPSVPPDGVSAPLTAPANTRDTMTRFALFHHMPPAPGRPPLPKTEADFAKVIDFHRALAALNSYPALLRSLGLVFDVELRGDFCPDSPAAGAYRTIVLEKVTAGFKWTHAPEFSFPVTSYVRDKKAFQPAPATQALLIGGSRYVPADVAQGFLALTPENFHLLAVDLDGALLKALGLADNAENARDQSRVGDDLPALRSSGVGLVANARGIQLLQSMSDNKGFDDALNAGAVLPRPLNARDLLRGFRLDIWSAATQEWRSLHQRRGVYRFGASGEIEIDMVEEGFLEPTAAQPADDPTRKLDPAATAAGVPQPGTDLYAHERIARWEGWSLAAARPGLALNRSPDPAMATVADPTAGQPLTPFKMTTAFTVVPGSLPRLRFGTQYRVRARAVDLAGNSVPLNTPTPKQLALPANGTTLPYLRFDPVLPPLVVLQQTTQAGGTLERMVIRSFNTTSALDSLATTDTDHRHVAPSRVGESVVEQHGMLDDASGKLRGDGATFNMIVQRDEYVVPTVGGVPLDPSPQLYVGYLPDPIARGAALRDLPNAPDNTNGRIDGGGNLAYAVLPDVQPRPGSVSFVPFGKQWPEREAFLLSLAEGKSAPAWNDGTRELTVSLAKGTVAMVDLSAYITESDLLLMGIWSWLREFFEARELASMHGGFAELAVTSISDLVALLTRLVLEGGHPLITPARMLTLVHAVQQPLGHPQFVQLPVVHRPADPIFASALRNSFTPITAWRSHSSHSVVLLGALEINGNTTSKIDLESRWQEYVDDPARPAPTKAWHAAHVETIPLPTADPGPLYSDGTHARKVAIYIPRVDALWFSAPFDELEGVVTPSDVAAPLHRFDDTKHRWVGYTAVANSRFEEYFPPGLDFTRSSDPLLVDVPSSARPLAPDIAYVVPTFGWEQQETSNVKSSVRLGNGLRVYLNRPWYSSGQDELLGVLLWNGPDPDYPTRILYKHLFTQWGNDPIWKTGFLGNVPSISAFPGAVATGTALVVEESAQPFDVAGHTVQFDPKRKLWFCDIEFYNPTSYMPFVRMALARYQPHSIAGTELSRIVLADYAQLTANRSAVVSVDPADSRRALVFVGGVAPQPPAQSVIEVTVQRRIANMVSDLAWEVAPASVVKVTENNPDATEPDAVLWSGSVVFAKKPAANEFRIVVREFERIQVDSPGSNVPVLGERLVYAAIVDYALSSNK